jgi:hypothetical protein
MIIMVAEQQMDSLGVGLGQLKDFNHIVQALRDVSIIRVAVIPQKYHLLGILMLVHDGFPKFVAVDIADD